MYYKNKNILIGGSIEICGLVNQLGEVYSKNGIKNIKIGSQNSSNNWYKSKFNITHNNFFIECLNFSLFNNKLPKKILNSHSLKKLSQSLFHNELVIRFIFNLLILPKTSIYLHIWDFTFYNRESFFKDLKRHRVEFRLIIVGSDFMDWPLFMSKFHENLSYKLAFKALQKLMLPKPTDYAAKMHFYEKYADVIFSAPSLSLHAALKSYYYYILPIDSEKIRFSPNFNHKLKIIHAPSIPDAKGTELIITVINKLKNVWSNFEFEYLTDIQQDELFEKLSNSDLLVDELFAPGPASLSHEAASAGCIVMTFSDLKFMRIEDMLEGNYIHINHSNFEAKLNELLGEFESGKEKFKIKYTNFVTAARKSVEKNNNIENISMRFLTANRNGPFDFYLDTTTQKRIASLMTLD